MMEAKKITTPLKAIRAKCLDCSGGVSNEVRLCVIPECALYPFRLGKNPNIKPMSEEQKQKLVKNLHAKKEMA